MRDEPAGINGDNEHTLDAEPDLPDGREATESFGRPPRASIGKPPARCAPWSFC